MAGRAQRRGLRATQPSADLARPPQWAELAQVQPELLRHMDSLVSSGQRLGRAGCGELGRKTLPTYV